MYVLHAWKSSLAIFIPSNFKLFLLVTLKKIMSTFKSYLKYGWPFILMYSFVAGVGILFSFNNSEVLDTIRQGLWYWLIVVSLLIGWMSFIICSFLVAIFARPSVDQKNCAYMRSFARRYFLGYLLLNLLFNCLFLIMNSLLSIKYHGTETMHFSFDVIRYFLIKVWYIINLIGILFYLDLGGGFFSIFKSVWFAVKMAFYNLPFVVIIAGLLLVSHIGCDYIKVISYMQLILYPILFCFIATLYTKKVHDQARLYQGN